MQKGDETEGVVQNVSSISTDTSHLQQTMEVQMGASWVGEVSSDWTIDAQLADWLWLSPQTVWAGLVLVPMRPSQSEDVRDSNSYPTTPISLSQWDNVQLTMLSPSTDTWIVDQQFRSALDSGIGNSQASKLPWSSRGQAKADQARESVSGDVPLMLVPATTRTAN